MLPNLNMQTLRKILKSKILEIAISSKTLGALSYKRVLLFVLFDSFNTIKINNTKEFEEGGALLPIFSPLPTDNQRFTLRVPPSKRYTIGTLHGKGGARFAIS